MENKKNKIILLFSILLCIFAFVNISLKNLKLKKELENKEKTEFSLIEKQQQRDLQRLDSLILFKNRVIILLNTKAFLIEKQENNVKKELKKNIQKIRSASDSVLLFINDSLLSNRY